MITLVTGLRLLRAGFVGGLISVSTDVAVLLGLGVMLSTGAILVLGLAFVWLIDRLPGGLEE